MGPPVSSQGSPRSLLTRGPFRLALPHLGRRTFSQMAYDTVTSTPVVPGLAAISTTGQIIGLILSRFYLHISRRKVLLESPYGE
jgi:hypothetical protein